MLRTAFVALALLLGAQAHAGATLYEKDATNLKFSGDFRFRIEQDWNSLRGNGTERDDRLRLRIRARGRFDANFNENLSAVVRLRTGYKQSQQSPNITFYDFDGDDPGGERGSSLFFDLWYLRLKAGGWDFWAGRNQLNLWRQDEYIYDDDISALGMGLNFTHRLGSGKLSWQGGYGTLPVGMTEFVGRYANAQVLYTQESEDFGLDLATAYLGTEADPDDPAGQLLLTDNNTRDYKTVALQAQLRLYAFPKLLRFGVTAGHNFKNYADEPVGSFSEFHKDDVDFYTIFVNWGSTKRRGDWLLGYYWVHIDALALNSSYTEDDWVRWGTVNGQTRATNMEGSEFRLAVGLSEKADVVARLYLVDAPALLFSGDTTKETANRARIDFNFRY